jgi:hypothetical protein
MASGIPFRSENGWSRAPHAASPFRRRRLLKRRAPPLPPARPPRCPRCVPRTAKLQRASGARANDSSTALAALRPPDREASASERGQGRVATAASPKPRRHPSPPRAAPLRELRGLRVIPAAPAASPFRRRRSLKLRAPPWPPARPPLCQRCVSRTAKLQRACGAMAASPKPRHPGRVAQAAAPPLSPLRLKRLLFATFVAFG